jgi:hypothetical protein
MHIFKSLSSKKQLPGTIIPMLYTLSFSTPTRKLLFCLFYRKRLSLQVAELIKATHLTKEPEFESGGPGAKARNVQNTVFCSLILPNFTLPSESMLLTWAKCTGNLWVQWITADQACDSGHTGTTLQGLEQPEAGVSPPWNTVRTNKDPIRAIQP